MERLQKLMARAGVASRRACEQLISTGRVTVNGQVVTKLGTQVDPQRDQVMVDGQRVELEQFVYLKMHKPAGYLTTVRDPQGRPTVMQLLPAMRQRVYPVGRLDLHTTGLLLLTNDGELALRLSHPSYGVNKTYLAEVKGKLEAGALEQLAKGVLLEDGITAPARLRLLPHPQSGGSRIQLTIHEGRNRQVRRMLAAVGHPVVRLARVRFGPIALDGLAPGQCQMLQAQEIIRLRQTVVLP